MHLKRIFAHPVWALVAAFGTYFCMYGFRKPYTVGTYTDIVILGAHYKFLLIISQTLGYVLAKWLGIKFVSEIKPQHRIAAILGLIGFAEVMLFAFALVPAPWNLACLFLNGMPLGIIFGLVLGFVEGRKQTELLIAGLCASFILSDGVSKSVGAALLQWGATENWMPALAGLVFAVPTLLFVCMLVCIPAPSQADIATRSAREPMSAADRVYFVKKYAPGLAGIVLVYLFVTLLRSIRADFAVELWTGLGYKRTPDLFINSELLVSFGVIGIIAFAVLIADHYKAFNFALMISLAGFVILLLTVTGLNNSLDKFTAMVLIGLSVYLPYVAVHAIIFERLIAITREKASVGFLMYVADSVGYTGYVAIMLARYFIPTSVSILNLFLYSSVILGCAGLILIIFCFLYFKIKLKNYERQAIKFTAGTSCTV